MLWTIINFILIVGGFLCIVWSYYLDSEEDWASLIICVFGIILVIIGCLSVLIQAVIYSSFL